uniref:alpha-glucosidase n=1 Tax=Dendroctonus ponderosae TaxID=77166 RepID=A0AAR5QK63_DENPD
MDKNKLELTVKTSPEVANATYKPIPEKEIEEQALSRPTSLIKVKASPQVDGADEKMLPADEEVIPEVVIFNNDGKSPQNGDTKMDFEDPKPAFVGLTKEELMLYADDPFWVRLRLFLFLAFWFLWVAMLVGAVLIIYAAPKCDPPPPRTWYQQGPLTQLPADTKPENLKLDDNIRGAIVQWNADAYEPLENNPQGLALIATATKYGADVIVQVEPAISNVWFEKSEKSDPEFDNYYIWRNGNMQTTDSSVSPPNNWVSPNNVSSWKYSDTRREYYYAPFNKPHLNFRNKVVIEQFSKVIEKFFALANVKGISLRNAAFLLVDSAFQNEEVNSNLDPDLTLTQYGFFKHSKTENLPQLGSLLQQWKDVIKNKTRTGLLMVAEDLSKVESYKVNGTLVVDMPLQSHIFSKANISVNETATSLNYTFNINAIEWPLWEAKTSAVPKDVLDIITYLLPGAPLINRTDVPAPVLLKIRHSPSIMRGICGVYSLSNNTILAFLRQRVTPGSPGILVAVNPTDSTQIANFPEEIPLLTNLQDVTVRYYSHSYNETTFKDVGAKRGASAVPVTGKSAIVLEYVPKKEE